MVQNRLRTKVADRLDDIEQLLKSGAHLQDALADDLLIRIHEVAKFWRILGDEDRDFLSAARYAIEEQTPWK